VAICFFILGARALPSFDAPRACALARTSSRGEKAIAASGARARGGTFHSALNCAVVNGEPKNAPRPPQRARVVRPALAASRVKWGRSAAISSREDAREGARVRVRAT
jgi:hypothetical protein